ncbi:MAG: bifunctional riboflavin kinase/FAD synthetase [Acidimicrobiia bacterium]|nr:bifunctional riboflavin kinase/FAD synthetase [Acidimicrobiia bacterium]
MEVIRDPQDRVDRYRTGRSGDDDRFWQPEPHALTIGVFDGVHLGHQAVIDRVRAAAVRLGVKSALVTFDPHPAELLRPELAPLLLTGLEHKLELLEQHGLDTVVVVRFDRDRAAESAESFVHSVLLDCLGAKSVIVGRDFHFGKGRLGNLALLTEMGRVNDFEVDGQPLVDRSGVPTADGAGRSVSSTAIRAALSEGDVATATGLLGRPHEVRGTVVAGDQRGRAIGFPTANLMVDGRFAIPGDGVYAGWYVTPDGQRHPSAINIGRRPTFYQHAEHSVVEAHLIGFDGDLYDRPARVRFVERLRGERRFDGIEALKSQLSRDVEAAGRLLTGMS